MLLRDLARKAHAIAFGDADIRRQLDQPVGQQQIGKCVHLVVLLHQRGEQTLRADPGKPGAEHRIGLDQGADQSERQRHDRRRGQREGRGGALGGLGGEPLLQQFELAEHLALHDALEPERALAGRRLEFDLHQGIDMQSLPAPARAEQQVDGVGRIACPEHAFAGGQRAELKPRPLDELKRFTARAAHQRGPGNLVWQSLVHPGRNLGRRDESVVDFPHPDQGCGQRRGKAHGQKHTYW